MTAVLQTENKNTFTKERKTIGMKEFGEIFISKLPLHIESLKIHGRQITERSQKHPIFASIDEVDSIQKMMSDVLHHPITLQAQFHTEQAFTSLLKKEKADEGLLKFFNGWNETHRTTSLVSAKLIMRLAADTIFLEPEGHINYHLTMSHMHEVAKDDFGLGHKGHDGMYKYMTQAFYCSEWSNPLYSLKKCNEFSDFLYEAGIANHKSPLMSNEYINATLDAMMISISSELWNGREYNFIAQFIEQKIVEFNPALSKDLSAQRNAKAYIISHSSEVENKHGLHALAAAYAYSRLHKRPFNIEQLKTIMLEYNYRVGNAFSEMNNALQN